MKAQINVPILYIAFNRPEISEITFRKLSEARPLKLYIAVDGPRIDKYDMDFQKIESVKEIVTKINWPCEVHYRFNEDNQGAEVNVSSSIKWAFENEEMLIVIEDDIIAPFSFLLFAQEMLIKYRDNKEIGVISASNFTPLNKPGEPDYFFSKYAHSGGGWATWKRVWDTFDLFAEVDRKHLTMEFLKTISNSRKEALHYRNKFRKINERGPGNSSWDRVGNYINRIQGRVNIVPRVNLTSNIGILGVHAKGETDFHNMPFDEHFIVKNHPDKIELNIEYDKHHFKKYICKGKSTIFNRAVKKLKRIISNNK